MGKTGYGERYIVGSHHSRAFIFDHQGEFSQRLHLHPCTTFEEIRRRGERERIVCFDYSSEYPGQLTESFEAFCEEVFSISKDHLVNNGHDCLFVCDELQKCCKPALCPQALKNIVQTGRRFGVDSLLLSQQPNRLSNEVREQVTELVCFNLIDENSLKFCESMGIDTAPIQKLKPLHYLWFNLNTGEQRSGVIDYKRTV